MTKCGIIKDLLPLYMDNVCSRESGELVEEHLKECSGCRKEKQMMEQKMEIEEEDIQENMDEEKLLELGKKNIERKAKTDFLTKATYVDIILNLLIVTYFMVKAFAEGGSIAGMLAMLLAYPFIAMFIIFIVWQIIFLINEKRNKETFVSQMISVLSILCKALIIIIVCVVGVASLFGNIS